VPSPPEDIWLTFPESSGVMTLDTGDAVTVFAGSLINPVTGELRLARPIPGDGVIQLARGARAALEGNFADVPRPITVGVSEFTLYENALNAPMSTRGITMSGNNGGLCMPVRGVTPNPLNPRCEHRFDDMRLVLPDAVRTSLFLNFFRGTMTVGWDTTRSESWLHADPLGAGDADNEQAASVARTFPELQRVIDGHYMVPVRNATDIAIPAGGAFEVSGFRQNPRDLQFVFPPGTSMEVATPDDPSSPPREWETPPSLRRSAVDIGGYGVPSGIRTPGTELGMVIGMTLDVGTIAEGRRVIGEDPTDPGSGFPYQNVNEPRRRDTIRTENGIDYHSFPANTAERRPPDADNADITISFAPIVGTVAVQFDLGTANGADKFHDIEMRQNLWITLEENVTVSWRDPHDPTAGGQLALPAGTVVNPIVGTYLLPVTAPASAQGATRRLETRSKARADFSGANVGLTRPGLTLPKGTRFYAARGAQLQNVQAVAFFSPYPLEATKGCANLTFPNQHVLEFSGRLNQMLEGVQVGSSTRTFDPISSGHICAYLDTIENTDFDDYFVYSDRSLRPINTTDARIESNDRAYPVGGRLTGVFPGPEPAIEPPDTVVLTTPTFGLRLQSGGTEVTVADGSTTTPFINLIVSNPPPGNVTMRVDLNGLDSFGGPGYFGNFDGLLRSFLDVCIDGGGSGSDIATVGCFGPVPTGFVEGGRYSMLFFGQPAGRSFSSGDVFMPVITIGDLALTVTVRVP